jgi:putative ABC transport system substrate-binding protein
MKRRAFITLLGGAAAMPLVARAATGPLRRVGLLLAQPDTDPSIQHRVKVFRNKLAELGWMEGQNTRIDARFAGGDRERISAYASELVDLKPDVLLASGSAVTATLQKMTQTIPIVFVNVADPVRGGFVASMSRPEANITGFTNHEYSMVGKWLELLREAAPQISRVAVVHNPKQVASAAYAKEIETLAAEQGVAATAAAVQNATEIEQALLAFAGQPNGGLIVPADIITTTHYPKIIELAARHRLPAIYLFRYFVTSGGLMSYGADVVDLYRRSAEYIDRILRGAKISGLPVQAPTRFELIVNLKTAKALGLVIPPKLLFTADEVIE